MSRRTVRSSTFAAALMICLSTAVAQKPAYQRMSETARREQIMQWGSKPDGSSCASLQAGLVDPSADIRRRAADALYWKCDRARTGQTAGEALCRSIELGNTHAGAWLLLGYAKPAIAKACLEKPIRAEAMVKLAISTKPLPAGFAATVALARLDDREAIDALRKAFQNPSLDEALFLLAGLRDIVDPPSLAAAVKLLDDSTRQAPGPDSHSTRALCSVALEALVARLQLKPSFAIDPERRYSSAEVDEIRKAAVRAVAGLNSAR